MRGIRGIYVFVASLAVLVTATPGISPAAFPAPKNGKILYHASDDDGFWMHIWRVNKDGTNRINLTADSESLNREPEWSPDGKTIAFASSRGGAHYDIYTMNASGNDIRRITSHPAFDGAPAWSPNGKKIAFDSVRDGSCTNIYRKSLVTGKVVAFTEGCDSSIYPVWSPTGERILFTSQRGPFEEVPNFDVWTMKPGGGDLLRLTEAEVNEWGCDWSPDGEWVLFIREHPPGGAQRDWRWDLYKMRSDGTDETQLTDEDVAPYGVNPTCSHAWAPNGKRILFRSEYIQTMAPDGTHIKTLPMESFGEGTDWQPKF